MSAPSSSTGVSEVAFFRPKVFLAGLVLGLALLCWAGYRAGRVNFHKDFVRFIQQDSPEGNYYPTVDELCAIVRERCRPDQTLVIVGGNSILLGVWQPAAELWSQHLQDLLGDKYCVLNFAFRGAAPADCGAVVAEVLRKEYPKQIYIADESPMEAIDPIGSDTYRFMFWQAYFSGRLEPDAWRKSRVNDYLYGLGFGTKLHLRPEALDIVGSNVLDAFLNFRNLWNRIGFTTVFTVPSLFAEAIPEVLTPRSAYEDKEPDATDPVFLAQRYPDSGLAAEMAIVRARSAGKYSKQPNGSWLLSKAEADYYRQYLDHCFPADLKPRTLILLSQNSPHYRQLLSDDEKARDDQSFVDSVRIGREAGIEEMEYGLDFTEDDFGDRTHLSKLGGAKLAQAAAERVKLLARRLGYEP